LALAASDLEGGFFWITAEGAGASLQFAYSEAVRDDGASRRAIVAEEHFLGSFELALAGSVAGEPRLRVAWTMCVIDFATFKSTPIPEDLRQRMRAFGM